MTNLTPLAVGEKSAAKLLDMKVPEFLSLVADGVLPGPRKVGPFQRWDTEELRAVMRGDLVDGFEDVKW